MFTTIKVVDTIDKYRVRHCFDLMTSLEMTFGRTEDNKTEGDMLGVCCVETKIYMVIDKVF